MDITTIHARKRALAVCLAALIVATSFAIVHTAAGMPHGVINAEYAKSAGIAPSQGGTDSAMVHAYATDADIDAAGTSASGRCVFRIENASMVSPSELGVWVSVTYPASDHTSVDAHAHVPRYIAFDATINGKPVEKTFNVTPYTSPGVRWGNTSGSCAGNEMFDAKGGLKPTTPLRINLTAEGVPRFTDNVHFTLTGTAYADEGGRSEPSSIQVTIPLPVVVLTANPGPLKTQNLDSALAYHLWYKNFTDFLLNAGDGTFKYNAEMNWSSYTAELQARGYSTQRYVTLWDPRANLFSDPLIGYTNPQIYAPDAINPDKDYMARGHIITYSLKADMEHIIRDHVEPLCYASKVNLVSFSIGGLVIRWFASLDPQYVNTVVTVATPHEGNAWFYEIIYNRMNVEMLVARYMFVNTIRGPDKSFFVSGRGEVEQMMAVPNTKTPSILYWLVPSYNCLIPPAYQPVDPYFHNTLNAPPASGVKYYNIYVDGPQSVKTDDQVYIQHVKEKNATGSFDWYRVTNVTQGNGDGMILARSAASFGDQYPTQVTNQPVFVKCWHVFVLNNAVIQTTIYRDLMGQ
jgi:pimeloyl-ACP methyl ester carboxylesterase